MRPRPLAGPGIGLFLVLTLLLWGPSPTSAAAPERVASVNLCTDQLLLMLAEPSQIVSVSHLASDPEHSYYARRARNYPENHARAEELIALAPDLILASRYDDPALVALLRGLGIRVEQLAPATDLTQIQANILRTADLLGRPEAAEAALGPLRRLRPPEDTEAGPTALLVQPNGYTAGLGTLQHAAIRLAGWRNLAAEAGVSGFSALGLERLLMLRPDRILHSSFHADARSRAQGLPRHPAIARRMGDIEPLEIPYRYWICGGPMLADAVHLLREARP